MIKYLVILEMTKSSDQTVNDQLYGNKGNDFVYGGQDPDLSGGSDKDKLYGGYEEDVLEGCHGIDFYNCREDSDIIVYYSYFEVDSYDNRKQIDNID